MSIQTRSFDLLSGVKESQTPLFLTLIGFRKSIAQKLGLSELPFIMHDNPKAILRKARDVSYPYGYFKMTNFEVMRDQQSVKNIRRHSTSIVTSGATNAMLSKGYLFPVKLTMEMHFFHNDARDTLLFIEKMALLGNIDAFSFVVSMKESSEWTVGVTMDEGPIAIPDAILESEEEPGAFDIQVPFTVRTNVGTVKSVPKINNEGSVTESFSLNRPENV